MPQETTTWQERITSNESVWNRAHDIHPILNPLYDESVRRILGRAAVADAPRVLDVGCGLGGWIFKILEFSPDATCVGIDMEASFIERARAEAEQRGLSDRVDLRVGDAVRDLPDERFDLIVCAGLPEAFGGLEPMLEKLRPLLSPQGRMIIGQGIWEREPDEECLRVLDASREDHGSLEETIDSIAHAGWAPVYGHKSTEQEWDDFVWACVDGLTRWALDGDGAGAGAETPRVLLAVSEYRHAWLNGYRGTLGYMTFVVRPIPRTWQPLVASYELARRTWTASSP
ncbi:SAM-dependent methyltransferase [Nocardiopsis flavescens]|uniref:SAM-dependent methyltransferase n=1 Tax=Nocardiopsis flavescens TaxID=758803 RepID=UPI00365B0A47